MRRSHTLAAAYITVGFLTACGNSSSGFSPIAAKGAGASPTSENRSPLLRSLGHLSASENVVHSFAGHSDGKNPQAAPIDVNGTIYGTTSEGGAHGHGTVYQITPSGGYSVLFDFGGHDGGGPAAALVYSGGNLYGTTYYGGASNLGTVFELTTSGRERLLHSFAGAPDGEYPFAGLIEVKGTFYGTTYQGGANNDGSVFSITPYGKETTLYSFAGPPAGGPDGAQPRGGVIDVNGTLYGTTEVGGVNGGGTVFRITRSGEESVLHSFGPNGAGPDGSYPYAGLVDVGGTLYGTTDVGGSGDAGTVFEITRSGGESVLHTFTGRPDGNEPTDALIAVNGTLYGTTWVGGDGIHTNVGYGCVFQITPSGGYSVLYSFPYPGSSGKMPFAGLLSANGTLYGTTFEGGANNFGTIFSLSL